MAAFYCTFTLAKVAGNPVTMMIPPWPSSMLTEPDGIDRIEGPPFFAAVTVRITWAVWPPGITSGDGKVKIVRFEGVTVTLCVAPLTVALACNDERSFGEVTLRAMPVNCSESAVVSAIENVLACADAPRATFTETWAALSAAPGNAFTSIAM